MRNRFIPICLLLLSLLAASCGGKSDSAPDTDRLRAERDSLIVVAADNRRELERMTTFFDEVATCIDSITRQENLIVEEVNFEKSRRGNSAELVQRLNQLTQIISDQRERIASLVNSLNNQADTTRLAGLRNTIAYLTGQLARKEEQIQRLRAEVSGNQRSIRNLNARIQDLSAEVGDLTTQNTALTEAVQVQTEIINEGYVLVASRQRLKELGVIEDGGLLRRSKVHLGRVTTAMCSKVNVAIFNELPIPSRKYKILSPAPESSYTIRRAGDTSTLIITDANAFWSLSNILVIQTQ